MSIVVAIPTYNVDKYVEYLLKSCLCQKGISDYRIVVVDDLSLDGTWEKIEVIASSNSKIECSKNDLNKGMCANWNILFSKAKDAEYFIKVDGDDWIEENLLVEALRLFEENPDINAVTFPLSWYIERTGEYIPMPQFIEMENGIVSDLPIKVFLNNPFSLIATVFKIDFIQKFLLLDNERPFLETEIGDWEFWVRFALSGGKLYFSNTSRAFYRKHDTNSSNMPFKQAVSFYEVLDKNHRIYKMTFGKDYFKKRCYSFELLLKQFIKRKGLIPYNLFVKSFLYLFK